MEINEKMRWLKRSLKNKYSITLGLMISFLVSGTLSLAKPGQTWAGEHNRATGEDSVVVGGGSNSASGTHSGVFAGAHGKAKGLASVVIGGGSEKVAGNTANGDNTAAIAGYANTTNGYVSAIIGGARNTTDGNSAIIAGGFRNSASGQRAGILGGQSNVAAGTSSAIAGGENNTSKGVNSGVLAGGANKANGSHSAVAGGAENEAKGTSSAVIGGAYNKATGEKSVVLGGVTNVASGKHSIVAGGGGNKQANIASGNYSAVLGGHTNKATSIKSVVVGGGVNTASGKHSGIIAGINNKAEGEDSVVLGGIKNKATGDHSGIVAGGSNKSSGKLSGVLAGYQNTASGKQSAVVGGYNNNASGENSATLGGYNNVASSVKAVVVGGGRNIASGKHSGILAGLDNKSIGENAVVLGGQKNTASGKNSAVIAGEGSTVSGENSVSIGTKNVIDQANVYVIGSNVNAKGATNAVVLGDGSKAVTGAISVGSAGKERQIKHVKAATENTDAVNFQQLKTELAKVGKGGDIVDITSSDSSVKIAKTNANGKKTFDLKVDEDKLAKTFAKKDASNLVTTDVTKWKKKLGIGDGEISENGPKINNTVTGKTVHTYVTKEITKLANKGLKFAGNTGGEAHLKLGEKLTINGDLASGKESSAKNVTTKIAGKTLKVEIATKPEFDEVTAGKTANKVIIGDNKISLGGKTYITNAGISANSQKITNVADGETEKDAVNKGQLDKAIAKIGPAKNSVEVTDTTNETKVTKTTTGKKDTYKVGLADNVKEKLKLIGDGVISDTHANKDHTVTGKTVFDYVTKESKKLTDKGLKFAGNTGEAHLKLGDKLTIKGGLADTKTSSDKNVKTTVTGKELKVEISTKPEFDEVTAGTTKKVIIGENKISLGGNTYITDTGINANNKKIINVDNPTNDKDAVNKIYVDSKLKKIADGVASELNYEGNEGGKQKLKLKDGTFAIKGKKNIVTTSKANGELELKLNDKIQLGKIIIDGPTGHITGLTNTIWDPAKVVANRAATEGQLKTIDDKVNTNTKNITNIQKDIKNVVKYDTDTKDKVTLQGGTNGTTITNLKAGVKEKDAVNKGQLDKLKAELEKSAKDSIKIEGKKDEIVVDEKINGNVKTNTIGLAKPIKDQIDRIGKGNIVEGDKNTVTGDTVHKYVKNSVGKLVDVTSKDATVKVTSSTDKDGKKTFDLAVNKEKLAEDFAKKDASNLDNNNVKQWAEKLSKDANIAKPDTTKPRLVTDKQVHDYVKNTAGSLINVVHKPNSGVEVTKVEDPTTKKKTFTVGLDAPTKKKIDEIGTGKITATDEKTVTGKTVYEYVKDNSINKDGSNLTVNQITNLSKKLVGVTSDDKTVNVNTKTDATGKVIYDLGVNKKALENDFAKIDASNINGKNITDWRNKLGIGTGDVKEGDQNTVTGDTVHKHLNTNYYNKTEINNKINKIGADTEKLSGGIATALAIASIPQVSDRHLVSVGAGGAYYNKAGGFAVGVSGTIPSRRFIYKVSAGIDTKKSFGVSAGVNINLLPEKRKTGLDPVELNQILASLPSKDKELEKLKKELDDLKIKVDEKGNIETKGSIPVKCGTTTNLCTIRGFEVDGREPSAEEKESLRQIVKILNVYYKDKIIDIVGHTDNTASHDYNSTLGLTRATNVVKYLQEYGLDKSIVIRKVSSRGETEIVERNDTPQGRYMNRRVELFFTDK
ncbi:OmpA family protein [Oceanivirga salmonicida]|uniref:OmpA family protein n=1 Tax=Oceanivirga salmonicida TaxID=1769291 RepID=UPI00082B1382|nr:OmpA family protein [Oceanivirga salmonicida]